MTGEAPDHRKESYSVLVVEDNRDDRDLCVRALQKAQADLGVDIQAHAVGDGEQGAAQIRERRFDAIFLDVNLPPPDGIELARQARGSTLNQTTPVIMITGAEDHGLMARAFQAGATLFLFKPIDRGRIQRLLEVSRRPIERERRKLQRVKVKCKLTLNTEQGRFDGETIDLSLGGMLVSAKRALPVGSAVTVNLRLRPESPPIRVAARVARVDEGGFMGLVLERVGKAESERLSEFLVSLVANIDGEKAASKQPL